MSAELINNENIPNIRCVPTALTARPLTALGLSVLFLSFWRFFIVHCIGLYCVMDLQPFSDVIPLVF
jgi:hypothetical protein